MSEQEERLYPGRLERAGKLNCWYCKEDKGFGDIRRHQRSCKKRPENGRILKGYAVVPRNRNPTDQLQLKQLLKLGHPGGQVQARDGYLVSWNENLNAANFLYARLDRNCAKTQERRQSCMWIADTLLPLPCILSDPDLRIRSNGLKDYQLGHYMPYTHHHHDDAEVEACRLSCNAGIQHKATNYGAVKDMENFSKVMADLFPTDYIAGPIFGENPRMTCLDDSVPIPVSFFAITVCEITPNFYYYESAVMPNNATCGNDRLQYLQPIEHVNDLTHLNFLSNIQHKCYTRSATEDLAGVLQRCLGGIDVASLTAQIEAQLLQIKQQGQQINEMQDRIEVLYAETQMLKKRLSEQSN